MKKVEKGRMILAIVAILALLAIVVSGILIIDSFKNKDQPVTDKTTDLYQLPHDATEYEKQVYEELADSVNSFSGEYVDGSWLEMVPAVSKMFISDYFTWSNKAGSYDVGGMDCVFQISYLNIQAYLKSTFYKDWDLYYKQYGKENLPTVKNVVVTEYFNSDIDYYFNLYEMNWDTNELEYRNIGYDRYEAKVTWEYEENENFDFSKFPTEASLVLVYRDNRLEVTDFVPVMY